MQTATVIYHAPDGDAKSCTMGGVTFNDGESVEINSRDNGHLLSKLRNGMDPIFEVSMGDDDSEPSHDPTKSNFKDGIDRARDYSFEHDQRTDQAARDARALAATPRKPGRPSNAEKAAKAEAEQKAAQEEQDRKEAEEKAEHERVEAERKRQEDANKPAPLPTVTPVQ